MVTAGRVCFSHFWAATSFVCTALPQLNLVYVTLATPSFITSCSTKAGLRVTPLDGLKVPELLRDHSTCTFLSKHRMVP